VERLEQVAGPGVQRERHGLADVRPDVAFGRGDDVGEEIGDADLVDAEQFDRGERIEPDPGADRGEGVPCSGRPPAGEKAEGRHGDARHPVALELVGLRLEDPVDHRDAQPIADPLDPAAAEEPAGRDRPLRRLRRCGGQIETQNRRPDRDLEGRVDGVGHGGLSTKIRSDGRRSARYGYLPTPHPTVFP
jgi:hypothetical protein